VTDQGLLKRLIPGCDIIYHLAAAFRKVNLPRHTYWDTNVSAMRGMLEIAREHKVRKFVYCSTQGVHGNVRNPPGDELSPIEPEDYYQFTKYEGEKVAQEFIREGMDITILRPTAIYGPGDPGRFLMMFRQVKKGVFPFFGNGRALYHPLYIDNFVDAFELAAEKPAARGQTYIIADDSYFTIREIVEKIGVVMNVPLKIRLFPFWPLYWAATVVEFAFKPLPIDPPLFRRRADWFRQNRAFRIDKARRELGYNPAVDLDTGLRRTWEWYKDNGYL
jgi:nucleoside-diphosphate-sugar epimerase